MKRKKNSFLITIFAVFMIFLIYPAIGSTADIPEQADYCYLPPFVMDPSAPPNVTYVYEKGDDIKKRAFITTYNATADYDGFFVNKDAAGNPVYYQYNSTKGWFEQSGCTATSPTSTGPASGNNANCFKGHMLNWALTSSIDISRKVLVGFGYPKSSGQNAGDVFTYTGCFVDGGTKAVCSACADTSNPPANCQSPVNLSQWEDGNTATLDQGTTVTLSGASWTYAFCLSKASGGNPTGLTIRVKSGATAPGCSGQCKATNGCYEVMSGAVNVKIADNEDRRGIVQEFTDKDEDYVYDDDAIRFGIRRWKTGTAADDRNQDMPCDNAATGNCTSTDKTQLLVNLLAAISKEPPTDPATPELGDMMTDIINYYKGNASTYEDKDPAYTQTPYKWSTDPAKACRKTVALFVTTGVNLGATALDVTSVSPSCDSLSYTDPFVKNACYGFHKDLSAEPGKQNIRTYVVHTTFYGLGAGNGPKLEYAASDSIGGGLYLKVDKPAELRNKLREVLLNILATSASASTVATLTTQSRESSTLTQAYFFPRQQGTPLKWVGYLRLLWSDAAANLREDTQNTAWLDLRKDKILSFYFDPVSVTYKSMTFEPEASSPYFQMTSCSPSAAGNVGKTNEAVFPIWNAQTKLLNRTTDNRTIKIGIDNGTVNGIVRGSEGEMYNFSTALDATLRPYWSYNSSCSADPSRGCLVNADCNSCQDTAAIPAINDILGNRGCTVASNCYYCAAKPEKSCVDSTVTGGCYLPDFGTCSGVCSLNFLTVCTEDSVCDALGEGTCTGLCTGDALRVCASDIGCSVDYGPCQTAVTVGCNTVASTCTQDCDNNCATSVIKYIRGYDKPTPSGSDFRPRNYCEATADCEGGFTCDTSTKTCSGPDILKTYKLGDIVYSTPRISPNSAVNGYHITYKDSSYNAFVQSNTVKQATPIVVVGANDGMAHAFKVAKIKDIKPASETSGSDTTGVADGSYQTGRFTDNPPVVDTAPPTDLGKELWSYIPYNAIPFLRWYCGESYCHIPMVDARFYVVDASIGGNDGDTRPADGSSWKRLLIGMMGIGGREITMGGKTFSSSVFVLDITDPVNPSLLWERQLPDNTLTSGNPSVVRLGVDETTTPTHINGTWYLVIGSGPKYVETNSITYETSANAKIFVLNLKNGNLVTTLDVGASGVAVGDMLAIDFDSDYQADDLYFGTYGGTGASQTGKLYRLRIRDNASYQSPANWDISVVVDTGRPIYAAPEIAIDSSGAKWLYFGTGLYLALEHAKATTDVEYLYGVKETEGCWQGTSCSPPYSNFLTTTNINFTGAKAVEAGCFCAGIQRDAYAITCDAAGVCTGSCGDNKICSNNTSQVCDVNSDCPTGGTCIENLIVLKVKDATISGSDVPVACSGLKEEAAIDCIAGLIKNTPYDGWKKGIAGMKSFSSPFVAGGLVDYTLFESTGTVCSLGGTTYLAALHYTTGTPYIQPTIYITGGTSGATTNLTINAAVSLGTGIPPLGESLVALPLSGDTYRVITQVSGGLSSTAISPSVPATTGYVLWLVK